jgi:hypothetical protein
MGVGSRGFGGKKLRVNTGFGHLDSARCDSLEVWEYGSMGVGRLIVELMNWGTVEWRS